MRREHTGRPRTVLLTLTLAAASLLTSPADAATWRGKVAGDARAPEAAARALVAREAARLGLGAGDQAEPVARRTSPSGTWVRLGRWRDGVRVEGGDVVVHQTRDGRLDLARTRDVPPPARAAAQRRSRIAPAAAERLARAAVPLGGAVRTDRLELVYFPIGDELRLAWDVLLSADEPVARRRVVVDAHTGEVLRAADLIRNVTGSGQVFTPNPVVTLQDNSLLDGGDADAAVPPAAYDLVGLQGLDPASGGLFRLTGPYVRAIDLESPIGAPPAEPTADFVYTRSNPAFEWVMVYHHIDGVQRWIQSLGFTNVANRRVDVDAHGLGGDDNAHYVPDGFGAGYIAMGDGGVDDGEDGDVIVHEYGHAVQDDQCPNCFYANESGAMGEGFSDFLAVAYFLSASGGFQDACLGDWDAVSYADESPPCLRRVDGSKRYPDDVIFHVHADGEIWSGLLWDVVLELSGGPSPTPVARDTVVALVLESHFLVPSDPSFIEGAQALLDADQMLFAGAHQAVLEAKLAARGLLPPEPAIFGGGAARTDCAGAFEYVNPTNRFGPVSSRQECRDNDPSCDADGVAGQCTFRMTYCLGRIGHPVCFPRPSLLFEMLAPRPDHRRPELAAIGEALASAVASLPGAVRGGTHDNVVGWAPALAAGSCAPPADLVVPLKLAPTGFRRSTVSLRTRALTVGLERDPDTLRLTCLP
jgi:hypothetical protein